MEVNRRILVIDDEPSLLDGYVSILNPTFSRIDRLRELAGQDTEQMEPLRFELTTNNQGQDGYASAQRALEANQPFAIAFIDMRMPPGWDGLKTARALRELDDRTYIVIVTAFADHSVDELQEAIRHNVLLLRKPFVEDEIYQLARNLCQSWNRDKVLHDLQLSLESQVRAQTEAILRDNALINAVVDAVPSALMVLDTQKFRFTRTNRSYEALFGLQVEGQSLQAVFAKMGLPDAFATSVMQGGALNHQVQVCSIPGRKRAIVEASLVPISLGQESVLVLDDITARKQAEEALFLEKEQAQVTLDSIADGVITTTITGDIQHINPVAERLTGWTQEEIKGLPLEQVFRLFEPGSHTILENSVRKYLRQGKDIKWDRRGVLVNRSGRHLVIEDSAAPIRNREGHIIGVVMVFHDVTVVHRLAEQVSYQSSHDMLTGLFNRGEFERRLRQAVTDPAGEVAEHALLYLDLDQFKVVNDTCGHAVGDELLRQVGNVLKEHIRLHDLLARLGGDEFGVLLECCSRDQATQIAEKIRQSLEQMQFHWKDNSFNLRVSIGLVPIKGAIGSPEYILSLADTACFAAKDSGRNHVHVYDAEDVAFARRYGEMRWVSRITRALDAGHFRLSYQTILPLQTKAEGEHYEILVQMMDDKGGRVPPGDFLPAAERYNLSQTVDQWVVSETLAYFNDHPAALERLAVCAINLSGHTLGNKDFLTFLIRQFKTSRLPIEKICFEITETAAIENFTQATRFMGEMKELGCRFALDDFGTGMCSFAYLKNLPADYLKIDGVFIKDILEDPIHFALVKSINEIGHVMGMKTIAEFVENQKVLEKLREIGVDFAQGYAVAEPKPLG